MTRDKMDNGLLFYRTIPETNAARVSEQLLRLSQMQTNELLKHLSPC
jgi:hypothetical protein